jgi:guanylate kinase
MAKRAKKRRGLLVVVSGPSGVGKSTVVKRLLKLDKNLKLSVSATTRPPRPGETNGEHYFFISQEEFDKNVKANDFLEWAQVHNYYYGTPLGWLKGELSKGKTIVCEVDVQGAASMKEVVEKGKLAAAAVFIFLIPPSVDILAFRLKKRKTEDEEVVNYRLRAAIAELQVMDNVERERTLLN